MGNRGKGETPQKLCFEEAQLPPHGKRGSAAQVERTCLNTQTKIVNIRVLERLISFCLSLFFCEKFNRVLPFYLQWILAKKKY